MFGCVVMLCSTCVCWRCTSLAARRAVCVLHGGVGQQPRPRLPRCRTGRCVSLDAHGAVRTRAGVRAGQCCGTRAADSVRKAHRATQERGRARGGRLVRVRVRCRWGKMNVMSDREMQTDYTVLLKFIVTRHLAAAGVGGVTMPAKTVVCSGAPHCGTTGAWEQHACAALIYLGTPQQQAAQKATSSTSFSLAGAGGGYSFAAPAVGFGPLYGSLYRNAICRGQQESVHS